MGIVIGIATIKSSLYIFDSLKRISKEALPCLEKFNVSFVVCINGGDVKHETENEVRRFFSCHKNITGHVLIRKKAGKNNAMNDIISFARKMNDVNIVHFFDDDVSLKKGTLLVNIKTLMKHEKENSTPVLVGSAFVVKRNILNFFLSRYSIFDAIVKWIFHVIITQPYLLKNERPKFCEGPSFCAYLKYLPKLPDDRLGVTDDAFLSNFFAVNGKNNFIKNGIPFIIKPKKSISYMKMPICFGEWQKQQVRIHAGIERSFEYFAAEKYFLEEYFSWSYAFNVNSRTKNTANSLMEKILYFIYMYLHERNRRNAQKFVGKKQIPAWSIAHSTKI